MNNIFRFLKLCSTDPLSVDRLIVSAFITINELSYSNDGFLRNYIIGQKQSAELDTLNKFIQVIRAERKEFAIEELIEIFEFIISPADKIVTGAVYTPKHIRDYIVYQCLSKVEDIENVRICDPACGCAGFLYTAAKFIKRTSNRSYAQIFENNIFGLDIQSYSIARSKLLLTLFALYEEGEDVDVEFNLFCGNALDFLWSSKIENPLGFDVIIGNPPYVCSRNMDDVTLALLKNWSVTKSGHPDLYIPFFQIAYENLSENGILGFITVNTFIKSINGRALRQYFAENEAALKIINFGGEQVFKDKNTYTCLCFLSKRKGSVHYKRTQSSDLNQVNESSYLEFSYEVLNHHDGWNLVDSSNKNDFINKVESVGRPFKDLYDTRNGIATLKNNIYKFAPVRRDAKYYYFIKDGIEHAIEKEICRRIVNANKVKSKEDLKLKEEQIIFPYIQSGNETIILKETDLKLRFPKAYSYLRMNKLELSTRDKGKVNGYEAWYAYGRRQSMDSYKYKLFFPHICERPTFVICRDADLLFYNGIAVISESLQELLILKTLLESDIFFEYIKLTTKDYSSGYISLSRNYIKNFGVPALTVGQKKVLRSIDVNSNQFWEDIFEGEFQKFAR